MDYLTRENQRENCKLDILQAEVRTEKFPIPTKNYA